MAAEEKDIGTAQAIIVHSNKYLEKVCVALIKKDLKKQKRKVELWARGILCSTIFLSYQHS